MKMEALTRREQATNDEAEQALLNEHHILMERDEEDDFEPGPNRVRVQQTSFWPFSISSAGRKQRTRTARLLSLCSKVLVAVFAFLGVTGVILAAFGHLRAVTDKEFWPDWAKPGNPGQYLGHYPTDFTRDVLPIPCHSHNDYWRRIPLYEALHYGCTGVEADVWKMDDEELYVGHSVASLTRNRTFRSLYLNPLETILDRMNAETEFDKGGNRQLKGIFDEEPDQQVVLLVDFKNAANEVFELVRTQLEPLRNKGYLTFVNNEDVIVKRPLIVVGTGITPFEKVLALKIRDIFFDAPLAEFGPKTITESLKLYNHTNSYYASTSMIEQGINWAGTVHQGDLQILKDQIAGAHKAGLMARYWEVLEWPIGARNLAWRTLIDLKVDYLNVDNLKDVSKEPWGRWGLKDDSKPKVVPFHTKLADASRRSLQTTGPNSRMKSRTRKTKSFKSGYWISPPLIMLKALGVLHTAFIRREFFGINIFGNEFRDGLAIISNDDIAGMMMCFVLTTKCHS